MMVMASPELMLFGGVMVTAVPGETQAMVPTVPEPDAVVESVITYELALLGNVVPAGAVSAIWPAAEPPTIAVVANRPVIVYVASEPTVLGLGTTVTPAVPLALMVYAGAAIGTVSLDVLTVKSVKVPAPGLVTEATVTVTESPAAMLSPGGNAIVIPPLVPGVVATNRQFAVASETSTPVTLEKLVGPAVSVRLMVPPAATAVVALKPSVYVAEALETRGEIDSVTADTPVPNDRVFDVVNAGPTAVNDPLPGVIVIVDELGVAGFVPSAVMLTTPPDATAVVKVKKTVLVPPPVIPVTTSVAAVPPDGVRVTE